MGKTTFYNLLDIIIGIEKEGKKTGGEEVFQKILCEYFFKKECDEKKFFQFLKSFEAPDFIKSTSSITDIDFGQFSEYVNGPDAKGSLSGKIMLSKPYLKTFHQDHQPEFNRMPANVQIEVLDDVKKKNAQILKAFRKMVKDREADKNRTILVLVALILKNIQIRTGLYYSALKRPAKDIICEIFHEPESVFTASKPQMAELNDDKHIKALIKEFFIIRRNQDLTDISNYFRTELDRYRLRAERCNK